MKRRDFLFAVALVVPTSHALAEQRSTLKRIALVNPTIKPGEMRIGGDPIYAIIFEEIKRFGYVEGVNLIVDRYSAEGQFDRFPEIAHQIVVTRPDVIYGLSNTLIRALVSETRTIPIVAWTGDPVAAGIVSSLARPGGNVTRADDCRAVADSQLRSGERRSPEDWNRVAARTVTKPN